jgi:heme/copper-type cytochrome/quinol oxidase subunit 2
MKEKLALDKMNFILIAIGVVIIIAGLLLMTGPSSTETHFEPDIFSTRRVVVAPLVCFVGFVFMIFAIMYRSKDKKNDNSQYTR